MGCGTNLTQVGQYLGGINFFSGLSLGWGVTSAPISNLHGIALSWYSLFGGHNLLGGLTLVGIVTSAPTLSLHTCGHNFTKARMNRIRRLLYRFDIWYHSKVQLFPRYDLRERLSRCSSTFLWLGDLIIVPLLVAIVATVLTCGRLVYRFHIRYHSRVCDRSSSFI